MTFTAKMPGGAGLGDVTARAVSPLGAAVATLTAVNTITETDLASFTLAANTITKAGQAVRLQAVGDLLNNTGAAATCIWRVKLAATNLLATAALSFTASASRRLWTVDITVIFETVSAERTVGHFVISDPSADTWAAVGTLSQQAVGYGVAAVGMTASQVLKVTGQLGVANAALDVRCHAAVLELLP